MSGPIRRVLSFQRTAVRRSSRNTNACGYGSRRSPGRRIKMSPELAFILTLALRMAVTAGFVVTASIITERSGPVIGALVATLPISAGPSYVFLAIDHDAAFVAQGALASLPINATTIVMGTVSVMLAQRFCVAISLSAALLAWLAGAVLVRSFA